jgi:hypothetical protein
MDECFEVSYATLAYTSRNVAAPSVPATALIENAKFEGWDAILELI